MVRVLTPALLLATVLGGCMGSVTQDPGDLGPSRAGGAASGGAAGDGGNPGSGGRWSGEGTPTEEEWREATAPVSAPHEVWTYDSCSGPHVGSTSVRLGPEYSVLPNLSYAPIYDANEYIVGFDVSLASYCTSPADCTKEPGGVCEGTIGDGYCEYPSERPTCESDDDCTEGLQGTCVLPGGHANYRLCLPTGVCEEPVRRCAYIGDAPCAVDSDCMEQAGGTCIRPIVATHCSYNSCHSDADCTDGRLCGCGHCLEAECAADSCPPGERCAFGPPVCLGGSDFHCTSPLDTCPAGEAGCYYHDNEPEASYWSPEHCLK